MEKLSTKKQKKALLVVTIAVFTDMLIYGLIVPILPRYIENFGCSQTELGLLVSSYSFILLLANPIFGAISDRFGRRGPLLWGITGLTFSTLLFVWANNFAMLIVARSLQGLAAVLTWTSGFALLADVYPPESRDKAMGIALSAQAAGTLLGPTVGGWLYQLGGYHLPFLFAAGLAFFDGILRLILIRDETMCEPSTNLLSPFRILENRYFLIGAAVVIVGAAIPSVLEPTLPVYLHNILHTSPGSIGLLFAVQTSAYALTTPLAEKSSRKFGHVRTIKAGFVLAAGSLSLIILSNATWSIAFAMFAAGVSMGLVLAPSLSYLAQIAEQAGVHAYGIIFAIYNTAFSAGMALGPLASSALADVWGLQVSYGAIAVILLFCAWKFK